MSWFQLMVGFRYGIQTRPIRSWTPVVNEHYTRGRCGGSIIVLVCSCSINCVCSFTWTRHCLVVTTLFCFIVTCNHKETLWTQQQWKVIPAEYGTVPLVAQNWLEECSGNFSGIVRPPHSCNMSRSEHLKDVVGRLICISSTYKCQHFLVRGAKNSRPDLLPKIWPNLNGNFYGILF